MAEELNTGISNARKIFHTAHAYPELIVELHFYRAELTSEAQPVLGQELRWIARDDFAALEFPPADAELIDRLMNASL
jgi:8-oxo-dGTP diphosphatase